MRSHITWKVRLILWRSEPIANTCWVICLVIIRRKSIASHSVLYCFDNWQKKISTSSSFLCGWLPPACGLYQSTRREEEEHRRLFRQAWPLFFSPPSHSLPAPPPHRSSSDCRRRSPVQSTRWELERASVSLQTSIDLSTTFFGSFLGTLITSTCFVCFPSKICVKKFRWTLGISFKLVLQVF